LHGTNPRSQGQEKEKKRLFHFVFHAQLHGLTKIRSNFWVFQEKYPNFGSNPA
jgi:hypothetical protein